MQDDAFRTYLEQLLRAGVELLGRLQERIGAETDALRSRDPDTLSAAVDGKLDVLRKLEGVGKELFQLVGMHVPAPTAADIEKLMDTPVLAALWDQLRDGLVACSHSNRVNGGVIEVNRRHTEQLIGILRGGTASLYGPGGRLDGAARYQSIGKA